MRTRPSSTKSQGFSAKHFIPDFVEYEGNPPEYSGTPIWNVSKDLVILEFAADSFPSNWIVPLYESEVEAGMNLLRLGCGFTGHQDTENPAVWTQTLFSQGVRRWGYNKVSQVIEQETQWGDLIVAFWSDYDGYVPYTDPQTQEEGMVLIDTLNDGGPVSNEVCYRTYDSGGPSLTWHDSQWKLCGTHVSSGNDYGAVLGDQTIVHLLDWIHDIID